jgi:crotonobetainyl-CoA:carnitine CoA-transferase CaiB-like acyl-CoA transferase
MSNDGLPPLAGLRVLDLSRALAGPLCAMILGDLGADVIKVENPMGGDEARAWGPPEIGGESGYYLSANRNKRSITINLRTEEGPLLLRRLAAKSDVLIENFGPGVPERYGIDEGSLQCINPRLIYCSVSSFAPGSAYQNIAGYDFVIQAMSGLMSITGEPEGQPQKVGVAVVDILAGLFSCSGILAALHGRDQTGLGQHVGVALMDAALASLVNVASNFLITGTRPRRWGNSHANLVPYQIFPTATEPIAIGVGNDPQFRRLCHVIGRSEVADDPRFRDNPARLHHRHILVPLLTAALQQRSAAEWVTMLAAERVPAAPVNNVDEIFRDPYIEEAAMTVQIPHPTAGMLPLVSSPIRLGGHRPEVQLPPPLLGEQTDDILRDILSLSPDEIDSLRRSGAI